MASLDWQLTHTGGVALVELVLTSEADVRIEVESNLRPVWPPRRQGRPAAGWTETGFEGVVAADERLVLGYASPADPVEPPATIVETEPVDGETCDDRPSARDLVRSLGEAGPPRDAVPPPDESEPRGRQSEANADGGRSADVTTPDGESRTNRDGPSMTRTSDDALSTERNRGDGSSPTRVSGDESSSRYRGDPQRAGNGHERGTPAVDDSLRARESGRPAADSPGVSSQESAGQRGDARDRPPGDAVDAWLDGVERRLEAAERLAAADTTAEARAAVSAVGGIDAVRSLRDDLAADRRRLDAVGDRYGHLEGRIAGVDIPVSALERLA